MSTKSYQYLYACIHFSHLFNHLAWSSSLAGLFVRSLVYLFVCSLITWILVNKFCLTTLLMCWYMFYLWNGQNFTCGHKFERETKLREKGYRLSTLPLLLLGKTTTQSAKYYNIGTYELAEWHTRCTWAQWHQNALVHYLMVVINSCVHSQAHKQLKRTVHSCIFFPFN